MLHRVQNLALPTPDDDRTAVPGHRLRPALSEPVFGALTRMGRAASARFNELRAAGRP